MLVAACIMYFLELLLVSWHFLEMLLWHGVYSFGDWGAATVTTSQGCAKCSGAMAPMTPSEATTTL